MLYGVGGRTDHAVVQRQPKSLFGRKMSVNDIGMRSVCLAQITEQKLCVRGQIIRPSYGKKDGFIKRGDLLVVAEHGTAASLLLCLQKCEYIGIFTLEKHQRCIGA